MLAGLLDAKVAFIILALIPTAATPDVQDVGAAQSPNPVAGPPAAIQFVAPVTRPPLPNIDGLTPDEVREFLGPPFAAQVLKDKRLAWSYETPDGIQTVYFKPESPTGTGGSKPAAPAVKPAQPRGLPPDGCRGLVARGPVATVAVVMPKTPAFVTPQIRREAVFTFAPYTTLKSLGTSGAWFLVTFQGARGPQSGYVHCTDVTLAQ